MTNLSLYFMRRLLAVSFGAALLLVGCTQKEEKLLIPPEEVLSNAAQESLILDSVRYELAGSFDVMDTNSVVTTGNVRLDGVLQGAGEQIQFDAVITTNTAYGEGDSVLSADVSVIVGGRQDLFLNLTRFESDGPNQLFNDQLVETFSGKWWRIPTREDQLASTSVTPDPRLLNAQAQVVKVVKDRGMASLHGRTVHRYDVAIDHDKLVDYMRKAATDSGSPFDEDEVRSSIGDLDADGEIWIDAETYQVQRLQWDLSQGVGDTTKSANATFSVDFFDHNSASAIVFPEDAQEFTPFMFLGAPSALDIDETLLPPGMEEDIMQQLLEQGAENPYVQ